MPLKDTQGHGMYSGSAIWTDPTTNERPGKQELILQMLEGPSPCDNCWRVSYCKKSRACKDFLYYASTGKVRHVKRQPKRKIYLKLFPEEK